jgi:hypothetical protein
MKNITPGSKDGGTASANGQAEQNSSGWTPPALIEAPLEATLVQPTLTDEEAKELAQLEEVVKGGWKNCLEVGHALIEIREKKLYRDKNQNFEQYVRLEFGLSKTYAYNLIGSAEVYDDLSSIEDVNLKPLNEAQTRCLISLSSEKRVKVWKKVIKEAGNEPITAKMVQAVVVDIQPKEKAKRSKPVKAKAALNLKPALELLDQIETLANAKKSITAKLGELREMLKKLAKK